MATQIFEVRGKQNQQYSACFQTIIPLLMTMVICLLFLKTFKCSIRWKTTSKIIINKDLNDAEQSAIKNERKFTSFWF